MSEMVLRPLKVLYYISHLVGDKASLNLQLVDSTLKLKVLKIKCAQK